MAEQTTNPAPEHMTGYGEGIWPEWVYPYSAGVIGGLLGGAAVSLVGSIYGLITGQLWRPINLVAATFLRDMQTMTSAEIDQFSLAALVVGLFIHVLMSVSVGLTFSFILPALPGRPLYWGWVIGPLLWVAAMVAGLPIINQVMANNVDISSFTIAMLAYGLVLGWWIDRTPMIHQEN